MAKFMFFTAVLMVFFAGVECEDSVTSVSEFCVDILNQTLQDAETCIHKPSTFTITTGDNAILSYLCCLGVWLDVTHNYMIYIGDDLGVRFTQIETATEISDVGNYVMMCKDQASENDKLLEVDYDNWVANGKTIDQCRAPAVRR